MAAKYLAGRLFYYVGANYAVHHDAHQEAVRWYEQAQPYLAKDLPANATSDLGIHGERLISMGVSYWRASAQDEAVNLTQRGLEMMVLAKREGSMDESALAVPYGNLATMYEALEEPDRASRMAARAEEIESR